MNERQFDALRYRGPGTDLTVGLLAEARGCRRSSVTRERPRVRPEHADGGDLHDARCSPRGGHVTSTRPLALLGDVVEGLRLTVKDGKIVEVEAGRAPTSSAASWRATMRAGYFGELALVDGTSRVGQTGITFFDTLYDENATCHIAYGFGVPHASRASPARA